MQFAKGILRLTNQICDHYNNFLMKCNIDHKSFINFFLSPAFLPLFIRLSGHNNAVMTSAHRRNSF